MNPMMTDERVAKALIDPAGIFSSPMAVVEDESLSVEVRIEILKRWEFDAIETPVADEEGFPTRGPGTSLDAVIVAFHRQIDRA